MQDLLDDLLEGLYDSVAIERGEGNLKSKIAILDTKWGKAYKVFLDKVFEPLSESIGKIDRGSDNSKDQKKLENYQVLLDFVKASANSTIMNMRMFVMLDQLIIDLLKNKIMNEGGEIVGFSYPSQLKVLEEYTDEIIALVKG
jgi:hypothetical protein